jgi:hypothetical protein
MSLSNGGASVINNTEDALDDLLGGSATLSSGAQSPAGSTPPLSGSAQPQAPANGQGVTAKSPVNYVPWVAGGFVLLSIIIFAFTRK